MSYGTKFSTFDGYFAEPMCVECDRPAAEHGDGESCPTTEEVPMYVTPAKRFAAAERRRVLTVELLAAGDPYPVELVTERKALEAASYWDGFPNSYSAEEVDAAAELLALCSPEEMGGEAYKAAVARAAALA